MSAHPESAMEHASMTTGKPVILIVDDSRVMRLSLKKMLKADFEVIEAKDGEEGWNKLEGNPSITAVFSDLSMPVLDGFGLMDRVRNASSERISKIPFIVLTGNEDGDGVKEKALTSGATDFITKPFRSSEIMDRANKYVLSEAPAESAADVQASIAQTGSVTTHAEIEEHVVTAEQEKLKAHEQELARKRAEEDAARRFAEDEAARMREMMLERKRAEDEAKARQRAEALAKHEAELQRKKDEEKARREQEFAQRAEELNAMEDSGVVEFETPAIPDKPEQPKIEVDMDYVELQLGHSDFKSDHVLDSKFTNWEQDSSFKSNRDELRVEQDSTLQSELNEALDEAIQESHEVPVEEINATSYELELEQPAVEEATSPAVDITTSKLELDISSRATKQEQVQGPAASQSASYTEEIHTADVDSSGHLNTVIPDMDQEQRISETEQIRQTLNVMRHQEHLEGLPPYSLLASVFIHMTLPLYKLFNRVFRLGKDERIKDIETRLYK